MKLILGHTCAVILCICVLIFPSNTQLEIDTWLFILFGFILFRVVNGALEYLAKDLGIAENTVLQGQSQLYCVLMFILFF